MLLLLYSTIQRRPNVCFFFFLDLILLVFLLCQVPASVRVRRETALPKSKPKPLVSTTATATQPRPTPTVMKLESVHPSSAPKPQTVDDSYMAFLEDMKALGALDS